MHGGESLQREVTEGRVIGKGPRGRKRFVMLNEFLKEASHAELKRKMENTEAKNLSNDTTLTTNAHIGLHSARSCG